MSDAAAALAGTPPAAATPPAGGEPPAGGQPPAAGTPPAGGTPPASSNDAWYSTHPDEAIRNWAANKGWADPNAALESGYNLEKLIGFEKAGRTIVKPKDDATPEEKATFWQQLGVPDKIDGYKLPEDMAKDPIAEQYREFALKNNMLPSQFEESLKFINEQTQKMQAANAERFQQVNSNALTELKSEYGAAYDERFELGGRLLVQTMGDKVKNDQGQDVPIDQFVNAMKSTGFAKSFMKMMMEMGSSIGEHKLHDNGEPPNGGSLTPQQAKARIDALKNDKEWTKAYLNGDAGKKAEMERLIKFAYPGGQ